MEVISDELLIAQQLFGGLGPAGIRLFSAVPPTVLDQPEPVPVPVPVAISLDPAMAEAGGPAFTLRVLGSDFVEESTIRWKGQDRSTIFISANALEALISASDIADSGQAQVTVFTPAPGGGASDALSFSIVATATAPVVSNVQVLTQGVQDATVMLDLTDPDGDVVRLDFTWFLTNIQAHQRVILSPRDIDLSGFSSGRLTLQFTGLGIETGFGPVAPNRVEIVATDSAGLMSERVSVQF